MQRMATHCPAASERLRPESRMQIGQQVALLVVPFVVPF